MQKRVGELERGKARVLCEDQDIGVGLALWCKILQGGRKKKARTSKDKRFQGMTQTLDFFK